MYLVEGVCGVCVVDGWSAASPGLSQTDWTGLTAGWSRLLTAGVAIVDGGGGGGGVARDC